MEHCMLDLETLGTGGNTVIVSIGAAMFDKGVTGPRFHVLVDIDSCLAKGLRVTGGTITWWMQQDPAAQSEITRSERVSLETALDMFTSFFKNNGGKYLWGNDPSFDNAILADAYAACAKRTPWYYSNNRCLRTLKGLAYIMQAPVDGIVFESEHIGSVKHTADGDALSEAFVASKLIAMIHAGALNAS